MDQIEGRLIEWDDARKFGFIQDSKGASVFAHIQDFPKHAMPKVGDRLRFKLRQTPKGLRAVEIQGSKIKSPQCIPVGKIAPSLLRLPSWFWVTFVGCGYKVRLMALFWARIRESISNINPC